MNMKWSYHSDFKFSLLPYCKTLIIRVTLFSRGNRPWYIHEILFSRIFMSSSMNFILEIISEDFIFASVWSSEFTRKYSPRE